LLELIWIVSSLVFAGFAAALSKRLGPELLIALVAACIVIANVLATKLITMFTLTVPAGLVVYSISFFLTDTLSEFYGKKYAYRAVWCGFIANLLFLISLGAVLYWPNAMGPEANESFVGVLGLSARVTVAAVVTYLISQFHDVWAYDFWGRKTKGRHLWIRNNASTAVSQTLDTVIFITIAFVGVFPILPLILGQLAVKLGIAVLDTPFLYFLRRVVLTGPKFHVFRKGDGSASTPV